MSEIVTALVDARGQVKQALEGMESSVSFTLRASFPKGRIQGNVVTWKEYSNVSTSIPVVDEIVFQVDLWVTGGDDQAVLSQSVNRAMVGIGFRRVYAGPVEYDQNGKGFLHRVFRFGRKVDKRFMRLID